MSNYKFAVVYPASHSFSLYASLKFVSDKQVQREEERQQLAANNERTNKRTKLTLTFIFNNIILLFLLPVVRRAINAKRSGKPNEKSV